MQTTAIPAFMDREVKVFVKEKETRKEYAIHHVQYNYNRFTGHNWVVVLKKQREYLYDWVILLPNVGFVFLPDCCYPTRNKIAYNWKEE